MQYHERLHKVLQNYGCCRGMGIRTDKLGQNVVKGECNHGDHQPGLWFSAEPGVHLQSWLPSKP